METGRTLVQEFVLVPLQNALSQFLVFVPSILGALLILLVGGLIAKLLEHLIVRGLKLLTVDRLADQVQLSTLLAKGGVRRKLSELVGAIVYWFIMLAFVVTALNALGLDIAAQLFQQIVDYLPNVLAAVFVIVVGMFVAAFLATTIRTAASNAGIMQSHLLGQAVQTVMVVLTIVAALKQVGFTFVPEVFLIILAGISLGAALAFGLGCKDLAGKWVNSLVDQVQSRKR